MSSPAARLRELLSAGTVLAPFVFDGVQAKLAQAAGFEALYMTGFGTAASYGLPDMGLIGLGEMSANAGRIAAAVRVPVIADADTGYGAEQSVERTVRTYERLGLAALHIEDQEWPKRCGFLDGKRVIARDEMVLKVRAALRARQDADFVVIARTDAYAPNGWEDAVARAKAYREAGADLVFVDGLKTREDIERAARDLAGIPQVLNTHAATRDEAHAMGFAVLIHIGTMLRHFADFWASLNELQTDGRVALHEDDKTVNPITELLSEG